MEVTKQRYRNSTKKSSLIMLTSMYTRYLNTIDNIPAGKLHDEDLGYVTISVDKHINRIGLSVITIRKRYKNKNKATTIEFDKYTVLVHRTVVTDVEKTYAREYRLIRHRHTQAFTSEGIPYVKLIPVWKLYRKIHYVHSVLGEILSYKAIVEPTYGPSN